MKIIAEYGQTMGGSIDEALAQVEACAAAGATHYKTQLLTPDRIAAADAPLYWANTLGQTNQRDAFAAAGLVEYSAWGEVAEACAELGLVFCASPFDLEAVDVLAELGATIKVASGDITYRRLLERVGSTGLPVILSTGASNRHEVIVAVDQLVLAGCTDLTVLACTLEYPTPVAHADVGRIETLRGALHDSWPIGYSDHTSSPDVAFAVGVLGGAALEVHCTLRGGDGDCADHAMALEPLELAVYIAAAARGELVRGYTTLKPARHEFAAREGARRSLVAARDLPVGHVLELDDMTAVRPAGGVSPWLDTRFVGAIVAEPITAGGRFVAYRNVVPA